MLFVLSAPSGAGKTSLCKAILSSCQGIVHSISYTTRSPRPGEQEGKDYKFVSEIAFQDMANAGEFVEWARVHDNYYGTSKSDLETILARNDVLLDIDVQGTKTLKGIFPAAVSIFVVPPSLNELKERLMARRTETQEEITRRLIKAKEEILEYKHYDYVVQNEVFEETVWLLGTIIRAERYSTSCLELTITDG